MTKEATGNIKHALARLKHLTTARYRNGHGVHSPAVYEFVSNVLFSSDKKDNCKKLEVLVKKLKKDKQVINFTELGGGSHFFKDTSREIKSLIVKSSVKKRYGRLLYRIANYYQPSTILEIGTSIGISTLYMALGAPKSRIQTIEGNSSVIEIAKQNATFLNVDNIIFHHGLFDTILPKITNHTKPPELVFMDGNHTYAATLSYFRQISRSMQKGIIILDDIYWSTGMKEAWQQIVKESVVSIDIFQFGIILIDEMLTPGYYKVRY
jgi:predicted O-methyltransferase YrrM